MKKTSITSEYNQEEQIFENIEVEGNKLDKETDCTKVVQQWMTTLEAADFLRISKASLLNLSSNGKVPYYKLQRRNRYLKSDLLRLLLSNRRGGFNGN